MLLAKWLLFIRSLGNLRVFGPEFICLLCWLFNSTPSTPIKLGEQRGEPCQTPPVAQAAFDLTDYDDQQPQVRSYIMNRRSWRKDALRKRGIIDKAVLLQCYNIPNLLISSQCRHLIVGRQLNRPKRVLSKEMSFSLSNSQRRRRDDKNKKKNSRHRFR